MQNKQKYFELPLEQEISRQIYDAIEGNVVEQIMKIGNVHTSMNYNRSMLEGHSFKVAKETLPHYYNLFMDVKAKLGFDEPVDFYITGDSSVNAFAISSDDDDEPHIVNVNSSLMNLMTDDELKFVIGHELGHLITRNASLMRLIYFVYPEFRKPPIALQYKIRLWKQLSELVADRYGFLAMPLIDVCVSAFFKMSSGLDFNKMQMKVDVFLEENNHRLEFFKKEKGVNVATHPINPIRVQALNIFSKSDYFSPNGLSQKQLQDEMDELTDILLKIKNTDIDVYLSQFIATSGLIIASADQEISEEEVERILDELSVMKIFPKDYLDQIGNMNVSDIFENSVLKIMESNPEMREGMLRYLISIVLADNEIKDQEMDVLFKIGNNLLGFSPVEIAQIMTMMIQNDFKPDTDSIY